MVPRLTGLVFFILALFAATPAAAERVALVIGNDAYTALPRLQKAVNDARAITGALEAIGFRVFDGADLTRRQTSRKLADFLAAIDPGDQVFVFFSGHGVAFGGENFLIPTDMPRPRTGQESLVRDEAFALSDLIARVRARQPGASFFVVDACRDNPFRAIGVKSIGFSKGLTRVTAPTGVFVLYSAGIGQQALDRMSNADPNPNSVFTRKLLPLLQTPGLSHVRLAKRVQEQVSALAARIEHRQEPAYYDQIIGEVTLVPGESCAGAVEDWDWVRDTRSAEALERFIAQYPGCPQAEQAEERLAARREDDDETDVAVGMFRQEPEPTPVPQVSTATMRAPIDLLYAAWNQLDLTKYMAQWAGDAVKFDLKNNRQITVPQLRRERRRLFSRLQGADMRGRIRLKERGTNYAIFSATYNLRLVYKNGRTFSETACETYRTEKYNGTWRIALNRDYVPCR